jgi:hypothetical protein
MDRGVDRGPAARAVPGDAAAREARSRAGAATLDDSPRSNPGTRDAPRARAGADSSERAGAMMNVPAARGVPGAGNGVEHYGPPLGAAPSPPQAQQTARAPAALQAQTVQAPAAPPTQTSQAPAAPPTPTAQTPAAPPTQAAAPAAAPVRKFEDLPSSMRQTMPRFTVGGAIYSDTPSARMLILNGQVYHEGDHPTPDTLLEQIKLKSAVMNYRGTRYEIAF